MSDQQLLEAVSYALTGSFEETERYRASVEHCAKILKEEEGIAFALWRGAGRPLFPMFLRCRFVRQL